MSKSMPQGLKEESPASYERYLGWICFQKCRKLVRKTNKFRIISNCSAWFSPNLCIFVCVCSIYIYIYTVRVPGFMGHAMNIYITLCFSQWGNEFSAANLPVDRTRRSTGTRQVTQMPLVRDVHWWYGSSLVRYLFHWDFHPKKIRTKYRYLES